MTAPIDPAVLKVADAVGALIEAWGFKRNMGRMWAVLYLAEHPLSAAELGERLGMSTGSISMILTELQEWGAVKKTWVVGGRKEHYEAETSIWKMVSRVFRDRELHWIQTASEEFEGARESLEAAKADAFVRDRVAGLAQLAQVGHGLLNAILQGESVDSLPLKTLGELARMQKMQDEKKK